MTAGDPPSEAPPTPARRAARCTALWMRYRWLLVPALVVLVLDLATKAWFFRGGLQAAAARYAELSWIQIHVNTGVAWSMFEDFPLGVVVVTLLLIPVLAWVYWRYFRGQNAAVDAAFGAILGGALGNGYDRVAGLVPGWGVGGVRDFISIDLGVWPADPWPTFNIADAGITVGFILLLLAQRGQSTPEDSPAAPADAVDEQQSG